MRRNKGEMKMMYDKDKLYTTKLYLEKLSNGIDPFNGAELAGDSLLNNVYLCRSFRFAADILDEILQNRCCVTPYSSRKKKTFSISEEERDNIKISQKPVGISVLAANVAEVVRPDVKGIPGIQMTSWLESIGLLQTVVEDGEKMKIATSDGEAVGIKTTEQKTRDGRLYKKNLYDEGAQRFIIENLEAINAFADSQRRKTA